MCDNAGEINIFKEKLEQIGVQFQAPNTLQQNGIVEREICQVIWKSKSNDELCIFEDDLFQKILWVECAMES